MQQKRYIFYITYQSELTGAWANFFPLTKTEAEMLGIPKFEEIKEPFKHFFYTETHK